MKRKGNIFQDIDWALIGLYFLILTLGWLIVFAVEYQAGEGIISNISDKVSRQGIWILASVFIGLVILIIDSSFFTSFTFPIYIFLILVLIGVALFAREVNGAKSWLEIGSLKIQPAEFAKYATCLALAKYMSMKGVNMKILQHRLIALAIIAVPVLLIIWQGDVGSAIIFSGFILVLYREGFPVKLVLLGIFIAALFMGSLIFNRLILLILLGIATAFYIYSLLNKYYRKEKTQVIYFTGILIIAEIVFIAFSHLSASLVYSGGLALLVAIILYFLANNFTRAQKQLLIGLALFTSSVLFVTYGSVYIYSNLLKDHHRTRIDTLIGKSMDPDANYNVNQSKMTIASGATWGKGYLKGTLTQLKHVPEQSTDFIFCTVGEEFGFVGSTFIILLYLAFIIRIIQIGERQRSTFSRLFCYGVAAVFFVQVSLNISMTIGLAPVVGIPLPFLSYGGSSVLAFTIMIFTLLRLDADRLLILR